MKVVLPAHEDRISPVLDVARTFALVVASADGALSRREVRITAADPIQKAKIIAEIGARVLICGAISWPIEAKLLSAGMQVIPNTCGQLEAVAAAYFAGQLTEQAFLMPGCPSRQHRGHHPHGRRQGNRR